LRQSPPQKQELLSFVVFDRYPGLVLVVSPKHMDEIKSIKDSAGRNLALPAPAPRRLLLKFLRRRTASIRPARP